MSISTAQTALMAAARVAAAREDLEPLSAADQMYEWLESKRDPNEGGSK